jgi:sugar lactone lactonase YvrE
MARILFAALIALLLAVPGAASAWTRTPATTFATLPAGVNHPEGITADAAGNIYVTTFDITKGSGPGTLLVFSPSGRLLRQVAVAGSSQLLLDLAFHPTSGALLVIDFGAGKVLNVNPVTGVSSVFTTIPGGASAGPNVLTFDTAGNVYISDSFQAKIWRTDSTGAGIAAWASDPLLGTSGVPPFGANGLAFNKAGTAMFVANTGNDTVIKIPVGAGGAAGTPEVFMQSINGADGLIIDDDDNIWVAANQSDEIVVVNQSGRVIAKLGDFEGIDPHGAPRGLLFPSSLVFSGGFLYVANLSLDLRNFNPTFNTANAQWSADVTQHTIARIPARIPPIQGLK